MMVQMDPRTILKPGPVRRCDVLRIGLLALVLAAGGASLAAQGPATAGSSTPAASAEATAVATGWRYLAGGDRDRAEAVAQDALRRYPRNPSVLAFGVEVALARGGSRAGLERYEQWLASRSVEDFYVLRRIARAALVEALGPASTPGPRAEAAAALTADGDTDVVAMLRAPDPAGGVPDIQALASAGDSASVNKLVQDLRSGAADPLSTIATLARSRSQAAVPVLVTMLSHARPEVRAAAARALGDLRATSAIPRLKQLLEDPVLASRMAAVESLLRMGDPSGAALLQTWFASDVPEIRLEAARASASNPDATWLANVRGLLQDRDPVVRLGAARLIAAHEPATARWALQQLAGDENLAVREEALRVMSDAVGGDFGQLRGFLAAADPMTRQHAAIRILELTR
jgi:HEAT repeat protein